MDTPEIGSMLMDAIPNPKTRRMVENAITRGLWDQMDELQPVVEELEEEMEDYNASCHGKGPRSGLNFLHFSAVCERRWGESRCCFYLWSLKDAEMR